MEGQCEHTIRGFLPSFIELDKPALFMPDTDLSFGFLEQASGRLARSILGRGDGDVLICLPFGASYYIALMACMRAGRTAVPIDPMLPADLRTQQVSRIRPTLALVADQFADHDMVRHCPIITLNSHSDIFIKSAVHHIHTEAWPEVSDHLPLHRLFTSGSSGQQTLVTISRRAMEHDVSTTPGLYGLTAMDTLSNIGRYTSSLHINAFWRCMKIGASFMPADLKSETPAAVIHRWRKAAIGALQGHPSLLDVIMPAQHAPDPVLSISHLIMGGEPLKAGWLARVRRWLPGLDKITHNYSSTETMLIACLSYAPDEIERMSRIPAGFPAPGKEILILDEAGKEVSSGMVGEISVTSHFIGSEMEGQDGAERLFQDPVSGQRTWRTRDLGRWLPDGSIEHLGRADRQMKINGLRIDPVFIEQCMETLEGVERSLVFSIHDEGSGQHLVAMYEGAAAIPATEIRSILSRRLPSGHIPSGIFHIERIPLTQRGKPDYRSLEAFVRALWEDRREPATEFTTENADPILAFLQETWATLLPSGNCDPGRSVFDQGADSVMLLKVISLIADKYERRLSLAFLLRHPTLIMQASALQELMRTSSLQSDAIGQEDLRLHLF